MNDLRLFGMNATKKFAQQVADYLDVELSKHKEEYFPDHEPYVRSDVNVRGCDVYVIQSLYTDSTETVADKFIKLLFFIGSLYDASAARVTAIIPYLAFSRQDRKVSSRELIATKYVAKLLEAVNTDRLLTIDVHNLSALQNSYRIPTDNLEAKNLIVEYVLDKYKDDPENLVVLSPDSGGMGRAKRFRNSLAEKLKVEVGLAYLDKTHTGRIIQGINIIGNVEKKSVIIIDDMISSGSTIVECKKAISSHGGTLWGACCTHGLFSGNANENLSSIDRIVVTDTIEPCGVNEENRKKLHIINTTKLFGQAIRRTHDQGGSISDLLR
jgi:ribose-phosphate pyrophosphokinase